MAQCLVGQSRHHGSKLEHRARQGLQTRHWYLKYSQLISIQINDLPVEILAMIFTVLSVLNPAGWRFNTGGTGHSKTSTLGWIGVSHVCRRWRIVLLDLGQLWADNVLALPCESAITTFLARARDSPVTLDLDMLVNNRDKTDLIDMFMGDPHLGGTLSVFSRARIINCSLCCDEPVIAPVDYCSTVLSTDAWMDLLRGAYLFRNLKHITIPITESHVEEFISLEAPHIESVDLRAVHPSRHYRQRDPPPDEKGYYCSPRRGEDETWLAMDALHDFMKSTIPRIKNINMEGLNCVVDPDFVHQAPSTMYCSANLRVVTSHPSSIELMKEYIKTSGSWDITTFLSPGQHIHPVLDPQHVMENYDRLTITHSKRQTFMSFSNDSTFQPCDTPGWSPLDPRFVAEYGRADHLRSERPNFHSRPGCITMAYRGVTGPSFTSRYLDSVNILVITRFQSHDNPGPDISTGRKSWKFLSHIGSLKRLILYDVTCVKEVLRHLPIPGDITIVGEQASEV